MTRRLLAGYLIVTLVVLAVLEIPLGVTAERRQRDELTAKVENDAVNLASLVSGTLKDLDNPQVNLDTVAENYEAKSAGRVVIVAASGTLLVDTDPPVVGDDNDYSTRPEIQQALDGQVAKGTRDSKTLGTHIVFVAVPVVAPLTPQQATNGRVLGAVRVTYPTSTVDARVRRYWALLGTIALVTLLAASTAAVLLARSVVRPLQRLQDAAAAFGGGELQVRAPTRQGPGEVRALAVAFNDTAGRLEELVSAQETFVADASHQLRTPLTSLRLRLELLADHADAGNPAPPEKVEEALGEVSRLSRLVDGLLALARVGRSSGALTSAPVRLDGWLEDRAASWQALAGEEGVRIDVYPPVASSAAALTDPERLAQVIDNLIANAIDATPWGTTICLSAFLVPAPPYLAGHNPRAVEIHVVDEGPGLSPEAREQAFDRFWRASPGAGRLGGSGLGLAIVRKMVDADGGLVELREAATGGVDATVVLPSAY